MRHTVSFYFYSLLIKRLIPFEAKYITLRGSKNIDLIQDLIAYYIDHIFLNHDSPTNEEEFNQSYLPKILSIFNDAFLEYIYLLQETFKISISADQYELFNYYDNGNYLPVIDYLECEIGINHNFESYHNPLKRVHTLIDPQIYHEEFDELKEYLKKFNQAYKNIEAMVKNQAKDRNEESKIDYIFLIVNHEFLSFLSHYATGLIYFDSPKVFTNNLHRALAHLKRALMDIYDGMIMECGYNRDIEYLRLRNQKISSLGQTKRMKTLIEELEKYYTHQESKTQSENSSPR